MSRNYDNWERLVAAVLNSRSTSFSSILSDFDPSSVDENLKTIEPEYEVIVDNQIVDEWVEEYESGVSITFLAFRDGTRCLKRIYFRNKDAINSETNLVEICESANRKRPFRPDSRPEIERVERFESGVHITLVDLIDGTRDIIQVRLSAIKFKLHEVETWWDKNRLTVYKRYNVWPRAAQVEQSTVSVSEGENAQRKP